MTNDLRWVSGPNNISTPLSPGRRVADQHGQVARATLFEKTSTSLAFVLFGGNILKGEEGHESVRGWKIEYGGRQSRARLHFFLLPALLLTNNHPRGIFQSMEGSKAFLLSKKRRRLSWSQLPSLVAMSLLVSLLAACIESAWTFGFWHGFDYNHAIIWQLADRKHYENIGFLISILAIEAFITFLLLAMFMRISLLLRWPVLFLVLWVWSYFDILGNSAKVKGYAETSAIIVVGELPQFDLGQA